MLFRNFCDILSGLISPGNGPYTRKLAHLTALFILDGSEVGLEVSSRLVDLLLNPETAQRTTLRNITDPRTFVRMNAPCLKNFQQAAKGLGNKKNESPSKLNKIRLDLNASAQTAFT